ncbi:hypothetical protein LMH73_025530 [Vibrio splendidus]|nr:hypothetical protein [Vibrio splendidus]MCC4881877.1 hypothetical protein [Vibrio splendidus]
MNKTIKATASIALVSLALAGCGQDDQNNQVKRPLVNTESMQITAAISEHELHLYPSRKYNEQFLILMDRNETLYEVAMGNCKNWNYINVGASYNVAFDYRDRTDEFGTVQKKKEVQAASLRNMICG